MDKPVLYIAAPLFNAREILFNSFLTDCLEERGYKTYLPQRDGFEYSNLKEKFKGKISDDKIDLAVQQIIYFLDMGKFIPASDCIIANFDEPLDEGMIVEASYARILRKYVIGIRTDARTPFGISDKLFGGSHFFPAFQCNSFLLDQNKKDNKEAVTSFVEKLDNLIQNSRIFVHTCLAEELPPHFFETGFSDLYQRALPLFEGISDIHSARGLEDIIQRYLKLEDYFHQVLPNKDGRISI